MAVSKDEILEAISNMTVIEVVDLISDMEEKFGVSAAAASVAVAAPAGGGDAIVEEQTEFDVVLSAIGDSKIKVIKAVRAITGLGLKEAKGMVDDAPSTLKEAVSKAEADDVKSQLEEVGASVELK